MKFRVNKNKIASSKIKRKMTDKEHNKFGKSDLMMMQRNDIKPGNGATLLSYQNHQSLKKHLRESIPLVDDMCSDMYIRKYAMQPEIYAHNYNKQQNNLKQENTRLFGRLVNILDVSVAVILTNQSRLETD